MTRRRVPAVLAATIAGLLAVSAASPALAGGKPEHIRILDPSPAEFPAGLSCEFPVLWTFETSNLRVATFPVQPNGDQLVRQTGHVMTTATNEDTGASLRVNTSDRQDFLFHPDGSIDVTINGHTIAAYFPGDLNGPGMFLFTGHLQDTIDSQNVVTAHHVTGRVIDICAALG